MKKIILCFFFLIGQSIVGQNSSSCTTKFHDDFDFWVGNWNVVKPDGTLAGTNTISKIQDGCIIKENYKSAAGNYTGTSYNFYNLQTKQWEQIWIDNQGQSLHLKGNREGNKMILMSDEIANSNGVLYVNKITWTINLNNTVRQHWEVSSDTKKWTTVFDAVYIKQPLKSN